MIDLQGVRALVLDGEQRASLAVTRSLVRSGCAVTVAASSRWSLAALSRGASWARVNASALGDPQGFAAEVAALAARTGAQVVLPITDPSVESIVEHRALFPHGVSIPFAGLEIYRAASDKIHVHRLALDVGLGVEQSQIILSPDDPVPSTADFYPGFVKPHRSVVGTRVRAKTSVRMVSSPDECAKVLRELPAAAFPVLLQRGVRGAGIGYFALRLKGRTLARFAHRRLREKPPAGGVSVLSESIELDDRLQAACDALLDRLQWEGVAMVECKEDLDFGGWRVMEINGRFWGSLQLAVDCGVDFPAHLIRSALRSDATVPPDWFVGRRLRWEWGDIDHLLIRLLRSRESLRLPAEAPGRAKAILRFLMYRPGRDRLEVLRLADPLPFLGECAARMGVVR